MTSRVLLVSFVIVLKTSTITDQVASHLRKEIKLRRWTGTIPGRDKLAQELGVNGRTIERALGILEQEGLLESQGPGKRRRIVASELSATPTLRVSVILYEREDIMNRYITETRHQLLSSGHTLSIAPKTLVELKRNPKRVAQMVESHPADLWIIQAGSRPVLEWFADSPIPALALFGRMRNIPIAGAGPDKAPAVRKAVQHLIKQGHRRIVFIVREERRKPNLGTVEKVFLEELQANGVSTGSYNMPEWDENPEGFHRCLDKLFRVTPPTAFLIGDWMLFLALQDYLGRGNKQDADKIALICTDYNPAFKWCHPPISHIYWDHRVTARHVAHWVNNVANGKNDRKQRRTIAKFIPR